MKKRKESLIQVLMVLIFTVLIIVLFTSLAPKEGQASEMCIYTVCPGDTLYSIAQEYNIKDWRKWAYETCQRNGIEQGGLIYPDQEIIIFH